MKKYLIIFIVLAFLLPSSIWAAGPTEEQVMNATTSVLATYGLVFLSSMFGAVPEGVEADIVMDGGTSTIKFDSFNPKAFYLSMAETGQAGSVEEMPAFNFKTMTGLFELTAEGDMTCNMNLKGGEISRLVIRTGGEDLLELTADGKDFSYLENIMNTE